MNRITVRPYKAQFKDEINTDKEKVNIQFFDRTGVSAWVTRQSDRTETDGWIPRKAIDMEEAEIKAIEIQVAAKSAKNKTVPLRVEQLYRQRKIATMLDQIKALGKDHSKGKNAVLVGKETIPMRTTVAIMLQPHQSKCIKIEPVYKTEKFCMVQPNAKWNCSPDTEILDGSYEQSKGGYIIIRNTTGSPKHIKKRTILAEGLPIEFENIPFMDYETIQMLRINIVENKDTSSEKSKKEKSREDFRKKLEQADPRLKRVLMRFEEMFLEANPLDFETLDIPDVCLPEKDIMPECLPQPHRRVYSEQDEEAIRLYVEAGLLSGFLKATDSEFVSPLLVVSRPGSTKKRCCLDARLINEKLLKPLNYPMPSSQDIINRMAKNTIFSCLDARSAFNQLKLSNRSQKLVSFCVYLNGIRSVYTTTSLPFGVRSAPALYQKTIDGVLHKFNRPHSDADSYIDDLSLGSRSDGTRTDVEVHLEDLEKLLSRLWEVRMRLSFDKCFFLLRTVEYCGQEISEGTVKPSEKHRKAIANLPPFSVKDNTKNALGRYLGILGYHRKYGGKNYAEKEKRIRNCVEQFRKKEISAEKADESIKTYSEEIKTEILKAKLVIPEKTDIIFLNTDASNLSWGAAATVKEKGTVSFHGGTFNQRVIDTYSIFSKELLGLLYGLEANKEFVIRAPKVVVSVDNLAAVLSSTTTKPHTKSTDIMTIMRIQAFLGMCQGTVEIKHCAGSTNLCADFLSRLVYESEDMPIAHMARLHIKDSKEKVRVVMPSFTTQEGSMVIKENDIPLYVMLKEEHDLHHYSLQKTIDQLQERDREISKKIIKQVIAECGNCCAVPKKIAPYSKLTMTPTPFKPLKEITVDFVEPEVESSQGHKYILTTRCELSRFMTGTAVKTKGMKVVTNSLDNMFTILGIRASIVRLDNEFQSIWVNKWAERWGIKIHFRCAKNSRSIGVERIHEEIHKQWEKVMSSENPRSWHMRMPQIIDPLNKSVHGVTKMSPYKIIFGVAPSEICGKEIQVSDEEQKHRLKMHKLARDRTIAAKKKYSKDFKWPIVEKGQEIIVKYTDSRLEKERQGIALETSNSDNPRVEVHFPDNPPAKQNMGIHKGHIYMTKDPCANSYSQNTDKVLSERQVSQQAEISEENTSEKGKDTEKVAQPRSDQEKEIIENPQDNSKRRSTRNKRKPDKFFSLKKYFVAPKRTGW